MTTEERKEKYKSYLRDISRTENTVLNYTRALDERFPDKINCESLFSIIDIDYLTQISNSCHNGELEEWSSSIGNHLPRAAINKYISFLNKPLENEIIREEKNNQMNIKNIILYGAPGVGKTHNYKNMISQIEQGKSQKEIFNSIQANTLFDDEDNSFQNVKDEKRVEFITFHQSFSYEDFIEGFRPQESGNLEIEDGIFKLISKNARNQVLQKETKTISFDNAYDMLREKYFENALDKIYSVSDVEILIHEFKENTLKVQSSNAKDNQYVKKSDLETVVNSFMKDEITKPSDIKKLDVKKDTISLAGLYFPFGKLISQIMKENKISEEKEKNFYLVIDEINRGNISKIFGELITLIEESKRDKYEVTLPYSKQKFSIPSNLYIIGTMNTTDKSIALIDVALRRRFTFIKMKPNTDLVLKSFQDTFEKLNKKITEHIGEDYQIGHSYFMNIEDSDLSFVLDYKIKPLLEEYYYGDDRISEVLNILGLN
ncbi:MAG: AAA family ATPase [Aliarcobacter sp.]|nr:AAA family ATPase [Aliarcobacter sp.]